MRGGLLGFVIIRSEVSIKLRKSSDEPDSGRGEPWMGSDGVVIGRHGRAASGCTATAAILHAPQHPARLVPAPFKMTNHLCLFYRAEVEE